MDAGDSTAQSEELIVLQSVFPEGEFVERPDSYQINLKVESPNPNFAPLRIKFSYPDNYPSKEHPVFVLNSEWLSNSQTQKLYTQLTNMFIPGEVVIFKWTDWLREFTVPFLGIESKASSPDITHESDTLEPVVEEEDIQEHYSEDPSLPKIYRGIPVTDRKSKFQAHLAAVHSVEEADLVLAEILKDKKVANAAHNISSYRILANGVKYENRDDDGETGAGDKLLYLLDKSNYINIIVVVTRWFGGILLGADRFKHITGVAKQLLEEKYKEISEATTNSTHTRFRPSEDVYSRIKWDTALNVDDFIIGYEDRFVGDMEIPFAEFGNTEIPFHRIRYFKKLDEVVWDRRKKIDKFFV